jgi:hypothetical protein
MALSKRQLKESPPKISNILRVHATAVKNHGSPPLSTAKKTTSSWRRQKLITVLTPKANALGTVAPGGKAFGIEAIPFG